MKRETPREKLARMLTERGYQCKPSDLWRTYLNDRKHSYPCVNGRVYVEGCILPLTVFSYTTMTDLTRYGFEAYPEDGYMVGLWPDKVIPYKPRASGGRRASSSECLKPTPRKKPAGRRKEKPTTDTTDTGDTTGEAERLRELEAKGRAVLEARAAAD